MGASDHGTETGNGLGNETKIIPALQFELGLTGLALLRQWLVGEDAVTQHILQELHRLDTSAFQQQEDHIRIATNYSPSAAYEAWADTYDTMPNPLIAAETASIQAALSTVQPGRAVDVACGTGRHTQTLLSLGHRVTAIDFSMPMLHRISRHSKMNLVQSDGLHLALRDQSFDLVLCGLLASHFVNLDPLIRELTRVAKRGGLILISDIHPWAVALGAHAMFPTKDGKLGYIRKYIHWHSTYLRSFKQYGLEVLNCQEPAYSSEQAVSVLTDLALSPTTAIAALSDLPVAIIWKLRRR